MTVLAAIIATMDKIDSGSLIADSLVRQQKYQDMPAVLLASGDLTFITKLSNSVNSAQGQAVPGEINYAAAQPFLTALENAYLAKNGFSASAAKLDDYLSAQNTPTPFAQMIGPNAAYIYRLWRSNGSAWKGNNTPTLLMTPGNVFAPLTTFSNSSVGGGGAVTAGLTGNTIQAANQTSIVQALIGTATGGTVVLLILGSGGYQATAALAYNASAATIQTALQALPFIGAGGVTCTGGPLGTAPIVCTFAGGLAGKSVPLIVVSNASATGGTVAASDITQGYAPAKGPQALIGVAINGTLSLHINYSGKDASGATITGRQGTLVIDNALAGSTVTAWTPQTAGDRISAVTAIASTGSPTATAGTFQIQSQIERVTS